MVRAAASLIVVSAWLSLSANIPQLQAQETVMFERVTEPREQAFSLLVPKGWRLRGGIVRIDPTRQGGPAQSIAAKVDFAVQSDDDGSVMIY